MDRIDINVDAGEGFGIYRVGKDEEILKLVSSANIACGFHAGDPLQMARTIELCLRNEVAVGAHPGYPDLMGFGRKAMSFNPEEIKNIILYQVGALLSIAKALGVTVEHVKPHGALYNKAAVDVETAHAVIEAVLSLDGPALVGLAGSKLVQLAKSRGLRVLEEGFADRNYEADGTLVSRNDSCSVISDPMEAAQRVIKMVKESKITSRDGKEINLQVDTICIHGDTDSAVSIAKEIRRALAANGIRLTRPGLGTM